MMKTMTKEELMKILADFNAHVSDAIDDGVHEGMSWEAFFKAALKDFSEF